MSKKILSLLLICLCIFASLTFAKEKDHEEEQDSTTGSAIFVMAIPQKLMIGKKRIQSAEENYVVEICYPEMTGFKDKAFEIAINNYFKTNAEESYQQLLDKVKELKRSKPSSPYHLVRNFNMHKSSEAVCSIGTFEYRYIGGDCGIVNQSYLTIDLAQNKILTLDDLFEDNGYKQQIKTAIEKQIKGRNQNLVITGDEMFYINEHGEVVIVYNLSDVEVYGSGVLEFIIPKGELANYKYTY